MLDAQGTGWGDCANIGTKAMTESVSVVLEGLKC